MAIWGCKFNINFGRTLAPGSSLSITSRTKLYARTETLKLKVSEESQSGFWYISSHPTSVPSFRPIGWPQLLVPGTLSQTVTLKLCIRFHLCFNSGDGWEQGQGHCRSEQGPLLLYQIKDLVSTSISELKRSSDSNAAEQMLEIKRLKHDTPSSLKKKSNEEK